MQRVAWRSSVALLWRAVVAAGLSCSELMCCSRTGQVICEIV